MTLIMVIQFWATPQILPFKTHTRNERVLVLSSVSLKLNSNQLNATEQDVEYLSLQLNMVYEYIYNFLKPLTHSLGAHDVVIAQIYRFFCHLGFFRRLEFDWYYILWMSILYGWMKLLFFRCNRNIIISCSEIGLFRKNGTRSVYCLSRF